MSQLELGFVAGVSAKHISFLETGRSRPSRAMAGALAEALELTLRETNEFLLEAGFAPEYDAHALDQPEAAQALRAVRLVLRNHAPFPAIALDWRWNVLASNAPARALETRLRADGALRSESANIMELIFDPAGLRAHLDNWTEVATHCLAILRAEERQRPGSRAALLARLAEFGEPAPSPKTPKGERVELALGDARLSLFPAVTYFRAPASVTAQELIIEQYFPNDLPTRMFFARLAAGQV